MNIQCENCAIQHELDPPAWVVSSGRPFRFRCSSCGGSQSVLPDQSLAAELAPEAAPAKSLPPLALEDAPPLPDRNAERGELATDGLKPTDEQMAQAREGAVFLKQNGQIYMVRDWDTLKRWITERRVDRHDLASEGGVRWEPIGSRADLLHLFADTATPAASTPSEAAPTLTPAADPEPAASLVSVSPATDIPFGGETPFLGVGRGTGAGGWHDDDTEGVPTGLPALPTEEGDEAVDPFEGDESEFGLSPPGDDRSEEVVLGELPGDFEMESEAPEAPEPPESAPVSPPPFAMPSAFQSKPDEQEEEEDWADLLVDESEERKILGDEEIPELQEPVDFTRGFDDHSNGELDDWAVADEVAYRSGMSFDRTKMALGGTLLALLLAAAGSVWWLFGAPVDVDATPQPGAELGEVLMSEPRLKAEPAIEPVPEQAEADAGDVDDVEELTPEPAPDPEPRPTPPPTPRPDPVPAQPRPDPVPAPAPAPEPAPSGNNLSRLVDQGWSLVDADPASAVGYFQQALAISSTDAEANYGFGYSKMLQGDMDSARTHMCKAIGDEDLKAEITSILSGKRLSCN